MAWGPCRCHTATTASGAIPGPFQTTGSMPCRSSWSHSRPGVRSTRHPTLTVVYNKSRDLYRPNPVPLDPDGQVVITEGTLDALHLAAIAASAGRLGEFAPVTSSGLGRLSPAQLTTVLSMSERPIVLSADGDKFGASGNTKWATALLLAGRQSAIVSLPPDPDAPLKSDGTTPRMTRMRGSPSTAWTA